MPRRKPATCHSNFILKRRFVNKFNEYTDWQDIGHADWVSLEDAQAKIKVLVQNYKSKHVEVWFEKGGELLDYNGNKTNEPIKFIPK